MGERALGRQEFEARPLLEYSAIPNVNRDAKAVGKIAGSRGLIRLGVITTLRCRASAGDNLVGDDNSDAYPFKQRRSAVSSLGFRSSGPAGCRSHRRRARCSGQGRFGFAGRDYGRCSTGFEAGPSAPMA